MRHAQSRQRAARATLGCFRNRLGAGRWCCRCRRGCWRWCRSSSRSSRRGCRRWRCWCWRGCWRGSRLRAGARRRCLLNLVVTESRHVVLIVNQHRDRGPDPQVRGSRRRQDLGEHALVLRLVVDGGLVRFHLRRGKTARVSGGGPRRLHGGRLRHLSPAARRPRTPQTTSPGTIASPSSLYHSVMVPVDMVGERAGKGISSWLGRLLHARMAPNSGVRRASARVDRHATVRSIAGSRKAVDKCGGGTNPAPFSWAAHS